MDDRLQVRTHAAPDAWACVSRMIQNRIADHTAHEVARCDPAAGALSGSAPATSSPSPAATPSPGWILDRSTRRPVRGRRRAARAQQSRSRARDNPANPHCEVQARKQDGQPRMSPRELQTASETWGTLLRRPSAPGVNCVFRSARHRLGGHVSCPVLVPAIAAKVRDVEIVKGVVAPMHLCDLLHLFAAVRSWPPCRPVVAGPVWRKSAQQGVPEIDAPTD